jgi:hypothetical protein
MLVEFCEALGLEDLGSDIGYVKDPEEDRPYMPQVVHLVGVPPGAAGAGAAGAGAAGAGRAALDSDVSSGDEAGPSLTTDAQEDAGAGRGQQHEKASAPDDGDDDDDDDDDADKEATDEATGEATGDAGSARAARAARGPSRPTANQVPPPARTRAH